jgi:hypothetical protein
LSKDEYIRLSGNQLEWDYLSKNKNPEIIELLRERIEYENSLSEKEYYSLGINKIDWKYLSLNSKNKSVIELLKEYPEKIDWRNLSINDNAIELLSANPEKISWKLNSYSVMII